MVAGPLLRPLTLDDAAGMADLLTECYPDEPTDPEVLRYRWANERPTWAGARWAVQAGGRAAGFASAWHPPWAIEPERAGSWELSLLPGAQGLGRRLVGELAERLRGEGARAARAGVWDVDGWLVAAVEAGGYVRERRDRISELDLAERRGPLLAMAERSRAAMAGLGIELVSLAAAEPGPGLWGSLAALYAEFEEDQPRSGTAHPLAEAEVRAELSRPDVRPDRVWLAMRGDQVAGLSYLTYPPVRGNHWTEFTGTARGERGRGVARAVKLASLSQALALGVRRARTGNDEGNLAMLHINRALGYRPLPGLATYFKQL